MTLIDFRWVWNAIIDWMIIIIAITIAYVSYYLIPLSILIIGNRQHALSILGHDGGHRLVSKNRKINDILTNVIVFYPMGININKYRKFHWEHHKHTNTEKDPEILLKAISPSKMEMPFYKSRLYRETVCDLFGCGLPQVSAFLYHIRPRSIKEFDAIIIQFGLITILVLTGYWLIAMLWMLSLGTSFWAFFRLRVWSEHVGGDAHETLVFDPSLIQKILFLPHNTWCHHEHHQCPSVSFSDLPNLRQSKTGIGLCEARINGNFRNAKNS